MMEHVGVREHWVGHDIEYFGSQNIGSVITLSTLGQGTLGLSSHRSRFGQGTLGRSWYGARWVREHWVGYGMEQVGSGNIGSVMTWGTRD